MMMKVEKILCTASEHVDIKFTFCLEFYVSTIFYLGFFFTYRYTHMFFMLKCTQPQNCFSAEMKLSHKEFDDIISTLYLVFLRGLKIVRK